MSMTHEYENSKIKMPCIANLYKFILSVIQLSAMTTMVWLNPYEAEKLSPKHLELLFPASFYQTDEELSQHMTGE